MLDERPTEVFRGGGGGGGRSMNDVEMFLC